MSDIERLLSLANSRLRKGRVGVTLELKGKGQWIYLRATFPPKPGSDRTQPYQQRFALKAKATPQAIKQAEATAKVVGGQLNLGTIDWHKWSDIDLPKEKRTIADWLPDLEKTFWESRDRRNLSHQQIWKVGYESVMKTLPKDQILSIELLKNWITNNTQLNSGRRAHYCTFTRLLCDIAEIPKEWTKDINKSPSIVPVNSRDLPSDEKIAAIWSSIDHPGWQCIFGLMATYGLRNHEVFYAEFHDFPLLRIQDVAKTGRRAIEPIYPEWADKCRLGEPCFPKIKITENMSPTRKGGKITLWFSKHLGITPYTLRHCYARRCAEFRIPPNIAARLMGHSSNIHERVYQAWIGEKIFLDIVGKAVNHKVRPAAP